MHRVLQRELHTMPLMVPKLIVTCLLLDDVRYQADNEQVQTVYPTRAVRPFYLTIVTNTFTLERGSCTDCSTGRSSD